MSAMTGGRRAGCLVLALMIAVPALAAPPLPPPAPVEVLALEVGPGGLGGQGGALLRQELTDVQFIAIGEDHGFAGPPQLAAAMAAETARLKGGPLHLAVEVGPNSTRLAGDALRRGGLVALDALLEGKPAAMPFLSNVEDAELAMPFAKAGRLWGIDQEFIGALTLLAEPLIARTRDPAIRATLAGWRDADTANLAAGRFGAATMTATDLARLAALKPAVRGADAATQVDDLVESARIYQLNETGRYTESNEARATLMRRSFLAELRGAGEASPRVILKMGAYHLGRGTTPTAIYDLGSLLPGVAAANGKRSLHILFVPISGKTRKVAPSPQGFTAVADYAEDMVPKLMDAAGIAADRVPPQGLVLIPLASVRQRLTGRQRQALGEFGTFAVLGYDYLVTTRDAAPARHFEAWAPTEP